MPIYEYVCDKCGEKTEVIQRMGASPLRVCPHCGGKELKKAFSAPAIQFKGSGFYITDYARGSGDGAPKKSSGEKADSKQEKAEKSEKSEGASKSDKSDKSDKSEKSETAGKSEKVEKKAEKKKKAAD
jgi:putative FmdB family regulatory protein